MLKYFSELSWWQKVEFILIKPFFTGLMAFIIYQAQITQLTVSGQAVFVVICLLVLPLIYVAELKLATRVLSYSSNRNRDTEKVLEISARYLKIEFTDVVCYKKSIKGKLIHRGFTQSFKVWEKEGDIHVSIHGNFPFPASFFNWVSNHRKIARELRTHAYFRT